MIERVSTAVLLRLVLGLSAVSLVVLAVPQIQSLFSTPVQDVSSQADNKQPRTQAVESPPRTVASSDGTDRSFAIVLIALAFIMVCASITGIFLVPSLTQSAVERGRSEAKQRVKELEENLKRQAKQIEETKEQVQTRDDRLVRMQEDFDLSEAKYSAESERLRTKYSDSQKELETLSKKLGEARKQFASIEAFNRTLEQKEKSLQDREAAIKQREEGTRDRQREIDRSHQEQEQKTRNAQIQFEQLQNRLADLTRQTGQAESEKTSLESSLKQLRDQHADFVAKLQYIEEFERRRDDEQRIFDELTQSVANAGEELAKRKSECLAAETRFSEVDQRSVEREALAKSKIQEAELKLAEAKSKEQEALRLLDEASQRDQVLNKEKQRQDTETQRLVRLEQKCNAAQQAAEETLRIAETQRVEAESQFASAAKKLKDASTFRSSNWPAWCQAESVFPSIDQLESWATNGNTYARLLLSSLQVLNALELQGELGRDFKYIGPAYREVGRYLSQALVHQGESSEQVSQTLVQWSKLINPVLNGKLRLSVPAIGSAFDPLEMQCVGAAIKCVNKVHNWSVINARAITEMKAEVS